MPRFILRLSGLDTDDGRVRLDALLGGLQNLSSALRRADELASGGGHPNYYEVVAMSFNSPATVELDSKVRSDKVPDTRRQSARILKRTLAAVESGDIETSKADAELLEALRKIVEPVGKKVQAAVVEVEDSRFDLQQSYIKRIDKALAPMEFCYGSVDGMLEQINIHANANNFTLYPIIGPSKIQCHFSAAAREKALTALGRRVEVSGRLAYRRDASFPYEIDVDAIQIYPPTDELTDLWELRGAAPNATGELSSEDFIAEFRSAW